MAKNKNDDKKSSRTELAQLKYGHVNIALAIPVLPESKPQALSAPPARPVSPDGEPRGLRLADIDLRMRESQTARHLAITLLVLLGVTFLLNVVTLIVLTVCNRLDAVPPFERMFAVWMPVLSGLVGSAVGFYLTKEKK